MKRTIITLFATIIFGSISFAQFRDGGKAGLNVFDSPKVDYQFDGVKTTVGGSFSQSLQSLNHENAPTTPSATNTLYSIGTGVNLATANLDVKTVLADGVAINVELYLSSRHHTETWVKGGFLQFDKIPFIPALDGIMKYTTIKVGQYDVNYGDAHFRRTDNAKAIYNPFMENYIMDEFATEFGAEAAVNYNGLVGVLAVTDGILKGDISTVSYTSGDGGREDANRYPAVVGKLGYDKQLNEDLRFRVTGSVYHTAGAVKNTLFGGDRTGSNYFGVMYADKPGTSTAFNGRYNPGLTDKLTTRMTNLFVKYKGLEVFGTYEYAKGRSSSETKERTATQLAGDVVYRFGKEEDFYVGYRYNLLNAEDAGGTDIAIDRSVIAAGWFVTDNVLMKAEYVLQQRYGGFDPNSIYADAKFNGIILQAVVGF